MYPHHDHEHRSHHKKPKKKYDWMTVFLGVMIVGAIAFVFVFGQR